MEKPSRLHFGVIVWALLGLAALLFYGVFVSLVVAVPEGGGESRMSNAFAAIGAWAALWACLLILLAIDHVHAERSSWTSWVAVLLVPLAGLAVLFATDYPGNGLCTLSLVALPLAIGVYLLIGALPRLRASAHVTAAKAVVLLLIAAFSAYPIDKFIS